jgi:hypothetical protein
MDPLSILSLTGNLVQFVELSSKLLAEARSAYKTGVGNAARVEALTRQIEMLQALAARASITCGDGTGTPDEIALGELSSKANKLAREVMALSNELQLKDPKSRFGAVRVAVKAHLKERDLKRLEQNAADCRADIVDRWAMMTRSVAYCLRITPCL